MQHDRDYYRCASDTALIEAARDSGHELAIALGERLDDLADIGAECEECRDELAHARKLIHLLRDEIAAYNT